MIMSLRSKEGGGNLKPFSRQWQEVLLFNYRGGSAMLLMRQKDTFDKSYAEQSSLKANLAN